MPLDYVLDGPNHVHAVDMNPRQNALLELKKSAIRELSFADFFRMFGEGYLPGVRTRYGSTLRKHLSERSRVFWDKRIKWFDNSRRSFYYRGTSGSFARMIRMYTDRFIKVARKSMNCWPLKRSRNSRTSTTTGCTTSSGRD